MVGVLRVALEEVLPALLVSIERLCPIRPAPFRPQPAYLHQAIAVLCRVDP